MLATALFPTISNWRHREALSWRMESQTVTGPRSGALSSNRSGLLMCATNMDRFQVNYSSWKTKSKVVSKLCSHSHGHLDENNRGAGTETSVVSGNCQRGRSQLWGTRGAVHSLMVLMVVMIIWLDVCQNSKAITKTAGFHFMQNLSLINLT